MKLELKHLTPYLPYRVEIYQPNVDGRNTFTLDVEGLRIMEVQGFEYFKPILRPMSSLTKELYYELSGKSESYSFGFWYGKHNGDNDKREYIYHSGYTSRQYFLCDGYGQFSYKMMDFFFKNHFDVFGLIPAGLATELSYGCR